MSRMCYECEHDALDINEGPCIGCYGTNNNENPKPNFKRRYGTIDLDAKPADDAVLHPSHYTQGGIECIDAIRSMLTPEEFRGFCKGNVIKYTWREKYKGNDESLKKAQWYLKQMVGGE